MAKFTPFLGNISGKLKSVVFAYNKAGSYIRSWRASTKPLSLSQLNAQASFASAVSSWHTLTDAIKGQWNMYASTFFKPKNPISGVAYSGYNAYVSLKNEADSLAQKVATITIANPATANFTADFFRSSQTPPTGSMSSMIMDADSIPINISLAGIQYSIAGGIFTADFSFPREIKAGIAGEGPWFLNPITDEYVGIAVYGSLPGQQNNQFVQNPEYGLLFNTPVIGPVSDWVDSELIVFEVNKPGWQQDKKVQYQAGDVVQAKAFLVSKSGASMPLNAVKFTVTS